MAISPKLLSDLVLYAPRQDWVVASGPPGVAKSASIYNAAKRAGAVYVGKYTATMEAVDMRLPYLCEGPDGRKFMAFAPPGDWPTEAVRERYPESTEIIINLDDFGQATPSVQKPAARAVYGDGKERMLGDYSILENVRFAATTNRQEDRAGVYRLETYVANRATLLEVEPNVDEWVSGALDRFRVPDADPEYPDVRKRIDESVALGIPDVLIAFAKFGKMIHEFKAEMKSFLSPRSMESLGRWMRMLDVVQLPEQALYEVAVGTIGEEQATKFVAFNKLRADLPDVDAILRGEDVKLPPKSEVLYILATSVLRAGKKEHCAAVGKLIERMSQNTSGGGVEVSYFLLTECLKQDAKRLGAIRQEASFRRWLQSNKQYFQV